MTGAREAKDEISEGVLDRLPRLVRVSSQRPKSLQWPLSPTPRPIEVRVEPGSPSLVSTPSLDDYVVTLFYILKKNDHAVK